MTTALDLPAMDLTAEHAVLGAAMQPDGGRETLALLAAALLPADFYIESNRVIFARMMALQSAGIPVDQITLQNALQAHDDELDRVGGPPKLAQLFDAGLFAIPAHVPSYIEQILEQAHKRALDALGQRITLHARNGHSSASVLSDVTSTVDSIRARVAHRLPDEAPSELMALLAYRFPPRAEIIGRGLLPRGGLLLVGGAPKVGKSLLLDNLCLQRARGRAWLGFPTDPGVTLVVQSELRAEAVAARFRTLLHHDADPFPEGRLHIKARRGVMLDDPAGLAQIKTWIEETGADVVRVDPLARHIGGDENSNRDMSAVVRAVDSLIERHGVAVVIAHHPSKPQHGEARTGGMRLRGASALFGAADTVVMMDKSDDGFLLTFELRHGPAPEPMRLSRTEDLWLVETGPDPELVPVAALTQPAALTYSVLVGAVIQDLNQSKATARRRVAAAVGAGLLAKDLDGLYRPGPAFLKMDGLTCSRRLIQCVSLG